jgi:hypothetical protein
MTNPIEAKLADFYLSVIGKGYEQAGFYRGQKSESYFFIHKHGIFNHFYVLIMPILQSA